MHSGCRHVAAQRTHVTDGRRSPTRRSGDSRAAASGNDESMRRTRPELERVTSSRAVCAAAALCGGTAAAHASCREQPAPALCTRRRDRELALQDGKRLGPPASSDHRGRFLDDRSRLVAVRRRHALRDVARGASDLSVLCPRTVARADNRCPEQVAQPTRTSLAVHVGDRSALDQPGHPVDQLSPLTSSS
jgi:hypothetical protein